MKRNKEHYPDPTPAAAEKNLSEAKTAGFLLAAFRGAVRRRGFQIVGEIKLKSEATGEVYE